MAVPPSFRFSAQPSILTSPCTSALLSLLIVYAWLQQKSVTGEVSVRRVDAGMSLMIFAGKSSKEYKECLREVQAISCATLFSPVMRQEAVQAMGILHVLGSLLNAADATYLSSQ